MLSHRSSPPHPKRHQRCARSTLRASPHHWLRALAIAIHGGAFETHATVVCAVSGLCAKYCAGSKGAPNDVHGATRSASRAARAWQLRPRTAVSIWTDTPPTTYRSGIAATGPPSPPHGAANAQADTQRCHAMCVKFLSDFQMTMFAPMLPPGLAKAKAIKSNM